MSEAAASIPGMSSHPNTAPIRAYWDAAAPTFDEDADHGLSDPSVRAAWARLLARLLPAGPAEVLDVGCGTGSLSELLAGAGHRVTGVDLAPQMLERARAKLSTAGLSAHFLIGDASQPPVGDQQFDVILARHLVWTLPEPEVALRRWVERLRPDGGLLVLVEGRWGVPATNAEPYVEGAGPLPWDGGVRAETLVAAVEPLLAEVRVESLSGQPELWGRQVEDERYVLVGRR
jgi:SAM-dependent methyltransferase